MGGAPEAVGVGARLDPRVREAIASAVRALSRYFDAEVRGLERVPRGRALLVGNHNANGVIPDTLIFVEALLRYTAFSEPVVALTHDAAFKIPGWGHINRALGLVPAAHHEGHRALDAGCKVLVYPGGAWEATRPSRDRDLIDFKGRRGFVKLALRARVPIVPVVSAGAHDGWWVLSRGDRIARGLRLDRLLRMEVFPIAFGLPVGLVLGPLTPHLPLPRKILVEVLDPIPVEGDAESAADVDRAYAAVLGAMQAALTRLAAELPRGARSRRTARPLPE